MQLKGAPAGQYRRALPPMIPDASRLRSAVSRAPTDAETEEPPSWLRCRLRLVKLLLGILASLLTILELLGRL